VETLVTIRCQPALIIGAVALLGPQLTEVLLEAAEVELLAVSIPFFLGGLMQHFGARLRYNHGISLLHNGPSDIEA
jgi:hypothetical protein